MSEAAALTDAGIVFRVIRQGPVGSVEEAARSRGVEVADVVKTIVVRRSADDFIFVLVPGGRVISWPKLRDSPPPASITARSTATRLGS
jgi:Cys-tRNA(Pro)/Cys-tRNA(Cys) deacylase